MTDPRVRNRIVNLGTNLVPELETVPDLVSGSRGAGDEDEPSKEAGSLGSLQWKPGTATGWCQDGGHLSHPLLGGSHKQEGETPEGHGTEGGAGSGSLRLSYPGKHHAIPGLTQNSQHTCGQTPNVTITLMVLDGEARHYHEEKLTLKPKGIAH